MDNLFNFLADNYVIFIIISVFILFVIIGILSSVKKKKKEVDLSVQPINEDITITNNNQMVNPTEVINTNIQNSAPIIQKEEDTFVPSLDAYESTSAEVKVSIPTKEENSEPELLIISDKEGSPSLQIANDSVLNVSPVSETDNSNPEPEMLIIEDKSDNTQTQQNNTEQRKSIFEE